MSAPAVGAASAATLDAALGKAGALWLATAGRGALVLGAAFAVAWIVRRRAHAAQHLVWRLTFGALVALPVLAAALPRWPLAAPVPRVVRSWIPADLTATALPRAPQPTAAVRAAAPNYTPNDHIGAARSAVLAGGLAASVAAEPGGIRGGPAGTSPPTAPDASPPRPWAVLLGVWAGGAGVVLAALARAWARRRALARTLRPVSDARTVARGAAAAARLGLRTPVRLLEADGAVVPSTWGLRRATVLLPADASGWPERRLDTVLLHELAHVARGDVRAQFVAALACALYWYNPLVWLAARAFERTCERACDDRVLTAGRRACDYAEDLLALARGLRGPQGAPRGAPAPAGALPVLAPGDLPMRLRAVLAGGRPRAAVSAPARVAANLLTLGLAAPLAALAPAAAVAPSAAAPTTAPPDRARATARRHQPAPVAAHGSTNPRTSMAPPATPVRAQPALASRAGSLRRAALVASDTAPRARAAARAADEAPILATLTARGGATQLVLTADAVELRFTPAGVRDIERSVRQSLARGADATEASVDAASAEGAIAGVRDMRMRFSVRDIAAAGYADDAVTLRMRPPAPADTAGPRTRRQAAHDSSAPRAPAPRAARRRGNRGEFVYEAVPEAEARRFVAALTRALDAASR